MNEKKQNSITKQNIEEYKKRMPKLRDKVISAVILFVIGAIMMTTVSFAWVTLSVSPEVTDITTAIASNGNLEIALANGTKLTLAAPGATEIGDSNIADMSVKNTKWGNLVNLADPSYGLNNMVLRPALLNSSSLATSPLYGAQYGEDGRFSSFITSFAYSKWNPPANGVPGSFQITDEYGVRAISSTKMAEAQGYPYERQIKIDEATKKMLLATKAYTEIIANKDIVDGTDKKFMETLATIMGKYMTARMTPDDASLCNPDVNMSDVENLRDLFRAFDEVLRLEREAMVSLANLQLFMKNQGDESKYTPFDEALLIAQKDSLASRGIVVTGLKQNLADRDKMSTKYTELVKLCEDNAGKTSIKWLDSGLKSIVDALVNLNTCTVQVKNDTAAPTQIQNIGATAALGFNNKSCWAYITNGIIYNFEQRTGARMDNAGADRNNKKGLLIEATAKRGITVTGKIYATINTTATHPSSFASDINNAVNNDAGGAITLQAHETYGFAIDFWVRTNAAGSYLTLEGNVITKTEEVRAMGKDINGDSVELYTVSVTQQDENGEDAVYSYDVYKLVADDGTETWYELETHQTFVPDDTINPLPKMETKETVIGYEGENRVWGDNAILSTDSTTQGSGSCYVFYTNSPEDLARSLKLLGSMKVAFIDIDGNFLAEGYMDTEHYFDDEGKVIVPLVLGNNSINLGEDEEGKTTLGITALEQNVAKLVTAIVYLDGTNLENEDVLATSDIQGQFNIQFGSNADLKAISNEELEGKEINVSVSVDKSQFDYDVDTDLTTNIEVNIVGVTPSTVKAFFVRKISETQGIPLDEVIEFSDPDGDGKWTASFTFTTPGDYVLRSVQIDGVERDLKFDERPEVTVAGFAIQSINWGASGNATQIMTADKTASIDIYMQFATNDPHRMPKTVDARFFTADGNTVNVPFTFNNTNNTWSGTATFLTSGEYELQYLVLDGNYFPIDEAMRKTATVYLGMMVAVYSDSPTNFLFGAGVDGNFENGMTDDEENLKLRVVVMDDSGNEMYGLPDVWLYYNMEGYTANEMGLNAELTWDGAKKCYVGEVLSKPGIFVFSRVVVGGSVITDDTTSPRFEIISPTPPSFGSGQTTYSYQYSEEAKGKITVLLNDANTIPGILGIVENEKGERITITDVTNEGYGMYSFNITGDGTYTLKEIRLWGVYDEDQNLYTEEDPMVFDLTGKDRLTTKIVSKVNVTFNNSSTPIILGTDANGNVTAEFLEAQPLPSDKLSLTITDGSGTSLPNVTGVKATYQYQGESLAYGGFSFADTTAEEKAKTETVFDITFTSADGKTFTQNSTHSLPYAGRYVLTKAEFTFDTNDTGTQTKTLTFSSESGNTLPSAPAIYVKTNIPTVSITAISPNGSHQTLDADGNSYNVTSALNSSHSATVYCQASSKDGSCGSKNITIEKYPTVTIKMSGIGKASQADLIFTSTSSSVLMYTNENNGQVSSYTWNTDGYCKRYIGSYKGGDCNSSPLKNAGTLTANTITLKDSSGVSYTIVLDYSIIINNPTT